MTKTVHSARQQLLDTAGALFFRDGYHAVGVDAIAAESGVGGKMTLYRHFNSKDALIATYLTETNEQFLAWMEAAMQPHAGQPGRQIVALFEAVQALTTAPECHGCAFQNAAAEFPARDHAAHQAALAHKRAVHSRLRALAAGAGAREPDTLANQLALLLDGAWAAKRMFGPDSPARSLAAAASALLAAQGGQAG